MVSAGAGFPKAFTYALHELIRHGKLEEVYEAARANQSDVVDGYVREALRFRPVFPFLIRYCPRAVRLCDPPADKQIEIAAGSTLKFAPLTAMFDPAVVERPEVFIPTRPKEAYRLFGGAPRSCIAETLIMSLFLPMLRELVNHVPSLLRAQKLGSFRYDSFGIERYQLSGLNEPLAEERVTACPVHPRSPIAPAGAPADGNDLPGNVIRVPSEPSRPPPSKGPTPLRPSEPPP
jgi:hypothetical protein